MGMTWIDGCVAGPSGVSETVRFLVDSGATYALLPRSTWSNLGLKPKRPYDCQLADGTIVSRQVSDCSISLAGREGFTPVILGEEGDEPLLGVITLEVLGLMLDPFKRELRPLRVKMYR